MAESHTAFGYANGQRKDSAEQNGGEPLAKAVFSSKEKENSTTNFNTDIKPLV